MAASPLYHSKGRTACPEEIGMQSLHRIPLAWRVRGLQFHFNGMHTMGSFHRMASSMNFFSQPLFQKLLKANRVLRLGAGLLALLIASCVNPGTTADRQEKAHRLSHDLQQLAPIVSSGEADKMAVAAIEESAKLSVEYKPMRLPWMNNWLINRGLRKRGLCYQWRNDLFPHLFRLKSKTLKLHLATTRRGTPFEHNGIVVTAQGQPFEQGIILDPWRKGGRLWWGSFEQDKRHPWKPLHRDLTPMVLRPLLMPNHYPTPASTDT